MNFKKIKMMSLATAMMVTMVGSTNAFAAPVGENHIVNEDANRQHIDAVDNEGTVEAQLDTDVTCKVTKNHFTFYAPTEISFGELQIGENKKDETVAVASSSTKPVSGDKQVAVSYETDGTLVGENGGEIGYTILGDQESTGCVFDGDQLWNSGNHTCHWEFTAATDEIGFTNWTNLTEGNYTGSVTFRAQLQDRDTIIG